MGDTFRICQPCRDNHHQECDSTEEKPCACIVCEGERIVVGDIGGNMPRHRKQ